MMNNLDHADLVLNLFELLEQLLGPADVLEVLNLPRA